MSAPVRPAMLARAASSVKASTSSSLCLRTKPFSTTSTQSARRIPPESPLFINIPNPPQDQSVDAYRDLKVQRGHLPVPKDVFKYKAKNFVPTRKNIIRNPTSAESKEPPRSDKQAWKREMAESRRENLRDGTMDLFQRKIETKVIRDEKSRHNFTRNRRAAMAPERQDERLTLSSIHPETLKTAVKQDPRRLSRAYESQARTKAIEDKRSERRRDAVQELYMNARTFIINEKQLEAEVERVFAPDHFNTMGYSASGRAVHNAWDLYGKPQSVAEMVLDLNGSTNNLIKADTTDKTHTLKRQKLIAEELTGGKMD